MFVRDLPDEDPESVRFVSGLASLPAWTRKLDGAFAELAALAAFALLVVWMFWLW